MQITGDKYLVKFEQETLTVFCSGFLDLRGKEGYKNIMELLDNVVNKANSPHIVILDIKDLEFLNSSGITTIGGFIIKLRKKGEIRLIIKCSNKHSWQERSIKGLEKLMSVGLTVKFE